MDRIDKGVSLINGQFDLPEGTGDKFNVIREELQNACKAVVDVVRSSGDGNWDYGTLVRVTQLLQEAKDVACQALILPHAK